MHIIKRQPFETAIELYPNCAEAIETTYRVLKSSRAETPEQLKQLFPSLDNFKYKPKWYVIDIGGNTLRLIAFIEFVGQKCFVKHIVTHAEYDRITDEHRRGKRK